MKDNMRTCAVCHSEYKYCGKCREDINKPAWFFSFCSDKCYNIYKITSDFENGNLNKDKAKNKLEKIDLSGISNFGTSYINSISKIMEDDAIATSSTSIASIVNENINDTVEIKTTQETQEIIKDEVKEDNMIIQEKADETNINKITFTRNKNKKK